MLRYEPSRYPVAYFPVSDISPDVLQPRPIDMIVPIRVPDDVAAPGHAGKSGLAVGL